MNDEQDDSWSAKTEGRTGAASQVTLREMLTEARDRSRGQGVVQGSTIFFKNLADSVGHANRNLKIGLAFLTVAFVIIAGSLGYMVVKSFQTQEQAKAGWDVQFQRAGEDSRKQLELVVQRLQSMEQKLAAAEEASKRDLEAVKASSAAEVAAARNEARQTRAELENLQKSYTDLRNWIDSFNKTYAHDRDLIVQRLGGLGEKKQ